MFYQPIFSDLQKTQLLIRQHNLCYKLNQRIFCISMPLYQLFYFKDLLVLFLLLLK